VAAVDPPLPGRTWAEIDLVAIADNHRALAARIPATDSLLAVVKADAYGHGLVPVARACVAAGGTDLAVATVEEARLLRAAGINANLHLLTPLLPDDAVDVARLGLIAFVSSREFLAALAACRPAGPLRCHVMIDTGMGREGFDPAEAARLLADPPPGLEIIGAATHHARADEEGLAVPAAQQRAFDTWYEALPAAVRPPWASTANSPAALRLPRPPSPRAYWRVGALLYGIEPFPGSAQESGVRPVLAWRARVVLVRDLPRGTEVGYGGTHTLARPSRVATLAAGYADGLSRRLSNRGEVLVRGRRCPIVGKVSMDQCQIDVTDVPETRLGDVATLIGCDGDDRIGCEEMATWIDGAVQEPTTVLSARVPRTYRLLPPPAIE